MIKIAGVSLATNQPFAREEADPVEDAKVLQAERMAELRDRRNRLLAESDWTQLPDASGDKEAWAAYRQNLRDAPAVAENDPDYQLPTAPG